MKRIFTAVLALILTLGMFSGCFAQERPAFSMWYWKGGIDEDLIQMARDKFDVDIQADVIGGDFLAKITTTLAGGGELPDILLLNDWLISLMPNADKFMNLLEEPFNADEIKDLYYDWKWNMALTPDGSALIAIPLDSAPTALFYRADLFEQAGLPSEPEDVAAAYDTWDKLFAVGDQIMDKTGAFLFDNIEMVFMQSLAQLAGNHFFDHDDNFVGDQPHIRACFDNAVKAKEMGILMNVNNWTPEWNAAINGGNVAAFVGGVWMQTTLKESAPDTAGLWRVTTTPGGTGNQGGSFIALSSTCKNPELAYEIIKWMMSPENAVLQFKGLGVFPSTPSSFDDDSIFAPDEFFGGQEAARVFAAGAAEIPQFYMAPRHNTFRDFFTNELYLVADLDKDPEEAWNDAVAAAQHELSK